MLLGNTTITQVKGSRGAAASMDGITTLTNLQVVIIASSLVGGTLFFYLVFLVIRHHCLHSQCRLQSIFRRRQATEGQGAYTANGDLADNAETGRAGHGRAASLAPRPYRA